MLKEVVYAVILEGIITIVYFLTVPFVGNFNTTIYTNAANYGLKNIPGSGDCGGLSSQIACLGAQSAQLVLIYQAIFVIIGILIMVFLMIYSLNKDPRGYSL